MNGPSKLRAAARIPHSRPTLGPQDERAVAAVVAAGTLVHGPHLAAFERALAARLRRERVLAVSSGSSALHLALRALGVGAGDEVALPSYGCISLLQAVRRTGAEPLLIDCDPETFQLDPDDLRRRLTRGAKACVLVHAFGLPTAVGDIAAAGPAVIEDVATAIGATLHGRPVGSAGSLTVCSFNATKIMTTGGGGAVATDEPALAATALDLVDYDAREDAEVRFNERMGEIAASLGISQLERLDDFLERRAALARLYRRELAEAPLRLPAVAPGAEPAWHRFVVRVAPTAAPLRAALAKAGIDSPRPIHRPLHRILGRSGFPGAETLHAEALSLPLYPSLSDDDACRVAREVRKCLAAH